MTALHQALAELRTERERSADRLAMLDQTIDSLTRLIGHTPADPPGATLSGQPGPSSGLAAPGGKAQQAPRPRRGYSDAEKAAAVALCNKVGRKAAVEQSGVAGYLLDRWRRGNGFTPEPVRIEPKHAPVVQLPQGDKRAPVERSPHAGQGVYVPSGIRSRVDEDAARRAAYADLEPEGFA